MHVSARSKNITKFKDGFKMTKTRHLLSTTRLHYNNIVHITTSIHSLFIVNENARDGVKYMQGRFSVFKKEKKDLHLRCIILRVK